MSSLSAGSAREATFCGGNTSVTREYCLRWNLHQPNLVQYFGSLLNQEAFVDVTLVSSEGKKLSCHKTILSSCSPYFQNVLEGNPCKHPIVILKDVDFSDLQTIISFIYHGEVNISHERLNAILLTASSLQIKGLAEVPDELKGKTPCQRKRDRDIEKPDLERLAVRETSSNNTSPCNSWTHSEDVEDSSNISDVPRKKLKKSPSAVTTSGSGSSSTNDGDPCGSGSFESGVGASVSRSTDDSGYSGSAESRSETLIRSSSGPPPLQPIMHLPGKSKSLDHIHDPPSTDSELSPYGDNQAFDDSCTGNSRAGENRDQLAAKLVTSFDVQNLSEDGKEPDDNTGANEENSLQAKTPSPSSSSVLISTLQPLSASGRRGRPLIRQPRIKRPDNDTGGELFISESAADEGLGNASESDESITTRLEGKTEEKRAKAEERAKNEEDSMMVPIVTVSQSSPTPPCSPAQSKEDEFEEEKSLASTHKVTTLVSVGNNSNSAAGTNTSPTLLMVPKLMDPVSTNSRGSNNFGAHLVKQISQPLLPSHTSVVSSAFTNHNPTIRRQLSQPNPASHSLMPKHGPKYGHRLLPMMPLNTSKSGTLVHLVPTSDGSRSAFGTTLDEDTSFSGGNSLYAVDTKSFIQLMPVTSRDGGNHVASSQIGSKFLRDDRVDSDTYGDLTIITKEDHDGKTSSSPSSPSQDYKNQLNVVQRPGHCPALRPGPALGCNFCWNSVDECGRILRRKTKYHCPECRINLCIVPCFQEYHEKSDKKKPRNKLGLPKPSSM